MESKIEVSKMTEEDIAGILEIENLSFSTPWSEEAFLSELNNNLAHYLIAKLENKVVAYGGMWIILDEAHITNIAVHPENRSKKIGELIVLSLIREALALGVQAMTLEVRESNLIAQNLYTRLGFEKAGKRKAYYEDNREDALILWKKLY